MGSELHASVVTPERAVYEGPARFVALPAWDGEIGVMSHRAPLLVKLGVGKLRIDTGAESGEDELVFLIDGGFAEMVDNRLTVLTEDARTPEELDAEAGKAALSEAKALNGGSDAEVEHRERAERRARLEMRMAPED